MLPNKIKKIIHKTAFLVLFFITSINTTIQAIKDKTHPIAKRKFPLNTEIFQ